MHLPYLETGRWLQSIAILLASGESLERSILMNPQIGGRKAQRIARELSTGLPTSDAFQHLAGDLSKGDLHFIKAASLSGALAEGLEVLARQQLYRADLLSKLLGAFTHPIGILAIGLFLIDLQPLLYGEEDAGPVLKIFTLHMTLFLVMVYSLKWFIRRRPTLLWALARRVPFFRSMSQSLALQRFVWALDRQAHSGVPIADAIINAANASGNSRWIKHASVFRRNIGLGERFSTAFNKFIKRLPVNQRGVPSIAAPSAIHHWTHAAMDTAHENIHTSGNWLKSLSKPMALLILSPVFYVIIARLLQEANAELIRNFMNMF